MMPQPSRAETKGENLAMLLWYKMAILYVACLSQ